MTSSSTSPKVQGELASNKILAAWKGKSENEAIKAGYEMGQLVAVVRRRELPH